MKKIIHLIILVILTCSSERLLAQGFQVSGNVSDNRGEALIGVSVVVKGSTAGTSTDTDGNFVLQVPGEGSVLVFSYVGMVSKEIVVSDRSALNVILEERAGSLDDVVIVGYGSQRRESVTGSITARELVVLGEGRDRMVGPLESTIDETHPKAYEDATAGEYLDERLREIGLKK